MKWALKTKDILPAQQMRKDQIVNHYLNNIEITKKSGLQKNLRNLVFKNIDIDNFYPRSYELSERNDFEDFLEDFKTMRSIAILKQFHSGSRSDYTEEMLKTSIAIWERKITYFDNLENNTCNSENNKFNHSQSNYLINARNQWLITDKEWYIISEEDMKIYSKEMEKLERMNKIGFQNLNKRSNSTLTTTSNNNKTLQLLKSDSEILNKNESKNNISDTGKNNNSLAKYKPLIASILSKMESILPQYNLNGKNNIWILKPSGLSRGRGITCMNSLNDILNLIKRNSNLYIVQKYIENPLIILDRKFDIRQWVLVTDLNPLTIWMYETPYIRFGAEDYKLEDFSNLFSHLTNNSIVKYSDNFTKSHIEGNMWDCEQFVNFLKLKYGRDVWKDTLQEKIKKIVVCSLESARMNITNRKGSHEIFGYDIMIDDELNAWLIEVNSSPAMDYSTVS